MSAPLRSDALGAMRQVWAVHVGVAKDCARRHWRRAFAGLGMDETVDIYFSAGPRLSASMTCDGDSTSTCSLWRVQISLTTGFVGEVARVRAVEVANLFPFETWGFVEPAASWSGSHLAYVGRRHTLATGEIVERDLRTLEAGGTVEVVTAARGAVQYPTWWSDSSLLYDVAGRDVNTGARGSAVHATWSWPDFLSTSDQFGVNTGRHPETNFEDPEVHPAPGYRSTGGGRIVSFGGAYDAASGEFGHIPLVTDSRGDDEEPFVLPDAWIYKTDGTPSPDPAECHHPTWNGSGTVISCTRYQQPESEIDPVTPGVAYEVRQLYNFVWEEASGTWVVSGTTIDVLPPSEFDKLGPGGLFPPRTDAAANSLGCRAYVWKFAQWCLSDRWIVATVYCTDNTAQPDEHINLQSRVVLIDTEADTTSVAAYTDLTSLVEEQEEGTVTGTYSGVFATCATPIAVVAADPGGGGAE